MASWNLGLLLALLVVFDPFPQNQALEISPTILKQVRKIALRCVNQTGVDAEIMQQVKRDRELSNDPAAKCFIHCMFDMFGLIDAQNVMHLESLNEILPEEIHPIINDLVSACGTKKGKDGCETAFETVKCYLEVNNKFIMEQVIVLLA